MRSKRRKTLLTVILLGFLISIFLFGYLAFGEDQTGHPTLVQLHIVSWTILSGVLLLCSWFNI